MTKPCAIMFESCRRLGLLAAASGANSRGEYGTRQKWRLLTEQVSHFKPWQRCNLNLLHKRTLTYGKFRGNLFCIKTNGSVVVNCGRSKNYYCGSFTCDFPIVYSVFLAAYASH